MAQRLSWPVVAIALAAVALLIALVYHRTAGGGGGAQISPQFLQMSPSDQKAALQSAERARQSRSGAVAPQSP